MKAVVWTRYGAPDVLQLQDVPKPAPKDHELLVRIYATTVTAADCELRAFNVFTIFWLPLRLYIGLFKPTRIRILGQDLSGRVESVGRDVTGFKEGDDVFASTVLRLSTYAEYTCIPETGTVALKPSNMTYDEAACVPLGGLEAWQYLHGNVRPGDTVLVIGAGGTIGTFGVQLAHILGGEVTALDSSGKLDMLRSIGADHVIDYTREDFTRAGQTYDVIFDAPGKSSFSRCKGSLKPNGSYLSANPSVSDQFRLTAGSPEQRARTPSRSVSTRRQDLLSLRELIEAGKLRSVIDRRYPLEQAAEAHRYAETGRKLGNIVLTVR